MRRNIWLRLWLGLLNNRGRLNNRLFDNHWLWRYIRRLLRLNYRWLLVNRSLLNYNWGFHRLGGNVWLRFRLWSRCCQNFPTCCGVINRCLCGLRTHNWRVINRINRLWVREETVTWRNNRCLLEQNLFGSLHRWLSRLRCIDDCLWRKCECILW